MPICAVTPRRVARCDAKLDTPIAGIGGCEDLFTSPAFWHIGFHQTMSGDTGLAELLVTGREHRYFRNHIDRFAAHPDAISDADVAIYGFSRQLIGTRTRFKPSTPG